ncbi:hypothetical protein C8J57DRAFT_1326442 [Mycena rebaudengoi]|nr:hypothetical protein C8J57DRAFT_1326442 [Mycena rebaudengoi]
MGSSSDSSELSSLQCLPIKAEQTISLRHSVLWPSEPVSHVLLPDDAAGWHYGAFIHGQPDPVAVISLFAEDFPIDNGFMDGTQRRAIRFRKFACDPAHQGQGIGTRLLLHSISVTRSELNGTRNTQVWYERRGMAAFGSNFYKGPVKYVRMKIDIEQRNVPV